MTRSNLTLSRGSKTRHSQHPALPCSTQPKNALRTDFKPLFKYPTIEQAPRRPKLLVPPEWLRAIQKVARRELKDTKRRRSSGKPRQRKPPEVKSCFPPKTNPICPLSPMSEGPRRTLESRSPLPAPHEGPHPPAPRGPAGRKKTTRAPERKQLGRT